MLQVLISAVTNEFGSYRQALAADLDRPGVRVETQEAFIAHGVATLLMLDDYIARCDVVIHIAGDQTGSPADLASLAALRARHAQLCQTLQLDDATLGGITYTQWEALLAVFHGKRLFIPTPALEAPRDNPLPDTDEKNNQRAKQKAHVAHLRRLGRYPEDSLRFTNRDRLVIALLRSTLYDLLPTSAAAQNAVVFKGLRSFDADDKDFFLELLPGPRYKDLLPDPIHFWKHRIEGKDSFTVGVMLGPSGCGKSSLVKAGLLPRLAGRVVGFHVEASAADTEDRLLKALRKNVPDLPPILDLPGTIAALAEGQGLNPGPKKVFFVLDQFEQWLHANAGQADSKLAQALRQCDGEHVQCLLLVRDDFSTALERFLVQLPVELQPDRNRATVDLFNTTHARRVLVAFGRASERLGPELSTDNKLFLDRAVKELAQDGWIIPIRLAVFAEMVRSKEWTPATWKAVGGMEGVGMTFLEEKICSATASPALRRHQEAAQAILRELLPPLGTPIRVGMKSYEHLLEKSGYAKRPAEFDHVLKLLSNDVRLITPTQPAGADDGADRAEQPKTARYYQLTHDYLVHSLEQWLRRKQGETPGGRAELRLALCAAAWEAARHDRRMLPSFWEWISIWQLTKRRFWNETQKQVMRAANWYHGKHVVYGLGVLLVLVGLLLGGWELHNRSKHTVMVDGLVQQLLDADSVRVPGIIAKLHENSEQAKPLLQQVCKDAVQAETNDKTPPPEKAKHARQHLLASLALAQDDRTQVPFLTEQLLKANAQDIAMIRDTLARYQEEVVGQLWEAANLKPQRPERLRAAGALATYAPDDAQWSAVVGPVVDDLLLAGPDSQGDWMNALRPVRDQLLASLEDSFRADNRTKAYSAAGILADYVSDKPADLVDLVLDADDDQFRLLWPKLKLNVDSAAPQLAAELARQAEATASDIAKDRQAKRHANAAAVLVKLNRPTQAWQFLVHKPDGLERAYLIHRLAPFDVDPSLVTNRLFARGADGVALDRPALAAGSPADMLFFDPDKSLARALLLGLGGFTPSQLPLADQQALIPRVLQLYRDDPDPGLHAASEWLLRKWQQDQRFAAIGPQIATIDQKLATGKIEDQRGWYVNGQKQTFMIVPGPSSVEMGSPPTEAGREAGPTGVTEKIKLKKVNRTFSIASEEVTVGQFLLFKSDHVYDKGFSPHPDCPINSVPWYEAVRYCNWLSEQEKIPPNQRCYLPNADGKYAEGMKTAPNYLSLDGYRLPTEAEWELACRAGSRSSRYYGETPDLLGNYACYTKNSHDESTFRVGTRLPNDLGLFDTLGNTYEWTMGEVVNSAALDKETSGGDVENPSDAIGITETPRVSRGGSFLSYASNLRAAHRNWLKPSYVSKVVGFRLARTMHPGERKDAAPP